MKFEVQINDNPRNNWIAIRIFNTLEECKPVIAKLEKEKEFYSRIVKLNKQNKMIGVIAQ